LGTKALVFSGGDSSAIELRARRVPHKKGKQSLIEPFPTLSPIAKAEAIELL
jgi:hypothetical protein